LKKEILHTWNGENVELTLSSDGFCYCPVCGKKSLDKDWRPYDKDGHPSYDICSCGFEYGFDDRGEPPYGNSWKNYREKWLMGEVDLICAKKMSKIEKLEQLKNLKLKT
jgi:hypothetical protein